MIVRQLIIWKKAGESALNSYANKEAIDFFSTALRLDNRLKEGKSSDRRRASWERQLGEAYKGLSKFRDATEHLEEALRLLDRPVPKNRDESPYKIIFASLCDGHPV